MIQNAKLFVFNVHVQAMREKINQIYFYQPKLFPELKFISTS